MIGIAALCLLLFAACRQSENSSAATDADTVRYVRPEIPVMMTDPHQQAEYYASHYWDGYLLADTAWLHGPDTEQLYANFLGVLPALSAEEATGAMGNMLAHVAKDSAAYAAFCLLGEKYLYHPNSPMRNEDYYMVQLEHMLANPQLDEIDKIRPADRLKQARKNRPGMKAADFTYMDAQGRCRKMSSIRAPYTFLFFFDPDCSNCAKAEAVLAGIPFLNELIEKGKVVVLAVYSGSELDLWQKRLSHMPAGWKTVHDIDEEIILKQLYDLPAKPVYYLLDKDKRVILKDARPEQMMDYLYAREGEKKAE